MFMYALTGPPGGITDINISPDTITACSFVVQWSKPSSDPVCGTVWYTVTISTEGGILIITDNTTMTNYTITGLNSSTLYSVNVTASNNAGSGNTTVTSIITNSIGTYVLYISLYVLVTMVCSCVVVTYLYGCGSTCRTFLKHDIHNAQSSYMLFQIGLKQI